MLIKIDFESEIAIYIQLRNEIIKGIAKGELQEGESLPSVRQLAGDIGINMHTVNKAYALLRDDGFISMDRRKGAVVSSMIDMITSKYKEKVNEEMEAIIAEAHCRGMNEEDFIKMCRDKFNNYK